MMKILHINGAAPYYTNSFLLLGEHGHAVVIDPAATAEQYEQLLRDNSAQLTHILLTHGHHDHVGAVQALCAAHPKAQLYLGAGDACGNSLFPLTDGGTPYTDGMRVAVDDMTFEVIATPGHSGGSVCLLCGDLLFAGDTLFAGDVGRTDLQSSDPNAMLRSLQTLLHRVPSGAQVLPGHGEFSTMEAEKAHNPYLRQAAEGLRL